MIVSRARPIRLPDGEALWFNTRLNGRDAEVADLELLAAFEDVSLDDLLDENLTQGDLILRLREALGQGGVPPQVEMRRRSAQAERQVQPRCRFCGAEGNSTRHHFVNRWIMKELTNYDEVGARSRCTVPVCGSCHVDLHDRSSGTDKSIAAVLNEREREFACDLLERLRREHPKVFGLLAEGDAESVYEARLVRDWLDGLFDR